MVWIYFYNERNICIKEGSYYGKQYFCYESYSYSFRRNTFPCHEYFLIWKDTFYYGRNIFVMQNNVFILRWIFFFMVGIFICLEYLENISRMIFISEKRLKNGQLFKTIIVFLPQILKLKYPLSSSFFNIRCMWCSTSHVHLNCDIKFMYLLLSFFIVRKSFCSKSFISLEYLYSVNNSIHWRILFLKYFWHWIFVFLKNVILCVTIFEYINIRFKVNK